MSSTTTLLPMSAIYYLLDFLSFDHSGNVIATSVLYEEDHLEQDLEAKDLAKGGDGWEDEGSLSKIDEESKHTEDCT